jgi:hypothetical protein
MISKPKSKSGRALLGTLLVLSAGLLIALVIFLISLLRKKPTELIIETLTDAGYSDRMAKFWVAISDHETGTWSSVAYRQGNNLFGMKVPTHRESTRDGEIKVGSNIYSAYASRKKSVEDLVLYMEEFSYPFDFETSDELVTFMKSKGYFTADLEAYKKSVRLRL